MSSEMREKKKTRYLSTYEFYEAVQIEYICCVLRARIYPKPKDKEYWNRVAEGKKNTIESISSRNGNLPSIFTDSDLLSALQRRVYREETYPCFVYKDESHKLSQEYFDLLYYYYKGVEVRFDIGLGVQIGKVCKYTPFDKKILIDCKGEQVQIPVDKVVRII